MGSLEFVFYEAVRTVRKRKTKRKRSTVQEAEGMRFSDLLVSCLGIVPRGSCVAS
jgi:hypothetical protein